jgi:hypothetical protein
MTDTLCEIGVREHATADQSLSPFTRNSNDKLFLDIIYKNSVTEERAAMVIRKI